MIKTLYFILTVYIPESYIYPYDINKTFATWSFPRCYQRKGKHIKKKIKSTDFGRSQLENRLTAIETKIVALSSTSNHGDKENFSHFDVHLSSSQRKMSPILQSLRLVSRRWTTMQLQIYVNWKIIWVKWSWNPTQNFLKFKKNYLGCWPRKKRSCETWTSRSKIKVTPSTPSKSGSEPTTSK